MENLLNINYKKNYVSELLDHFRFIFQKNFFLSFYVDYSWL